MNEEDIRKLGLYATSYSRFDGAPYKTEHRGGPIWAIVDGLGYCLNKAGDWEIEPRPSERDQAFLDRCRFLREEALQRLAALPYDPLN